MRGVEETLDLMGTPQCPAAEGVAGACLANQGVVCRVMERAHREDDGLGMNAAQSGFIQHEATGGLFLTINSDPSTVTKFCHGSALPVLHDGKHPGGRASYTYCPVWQEEKLRIEEGRADLFVEAEPESIAEGVTVNALEDPFQARRDLEMLAS